MGDYHLMKITNKALTHTLNTKLSGFHSQNQRNRTSKKVPFGDAKAQEGYTFYWGTRELWYSRLKYTFKESGS